MAKGKGGIIKKILFLFIAGIIAFAGYWAYENVFKSNVRLDGKKYTYIFIKSNSSYQEMLDEIYSQNIIEDKESFEWTARKMDLQNNVHFGKFRIDESMSNRSIVNAIKKNKQEKVKLYFNSQIRTQEQFINYVSEKIEVEKSADEIYALPKVNLAFPETGIGIYPALGGTQRSALRIGKGLAKYLILSGKNLSAKEAEEI